MKIGTLHCPYCSSTWVAMFPADLDVFPCPFCSGLSEPPVDVQSITGKCTECGMPLDDHSWMGERASGCPPKDGREREAA